MMKERKSLKNIVDAPKFYIMINFMYWLRIYLVVKPYCKKYNSELSLIS